MHESAFTRPRSATAFAHAWLDAWNARNVDRILAHYADDVVFRSPYVAALGEPSGTLRDKAALHEYFTLAMARVPDLSFELDGVLVGVASIAVCYHGVGGIPAVEVMGSADGRLASDVSCHYPPGTTGPRDDRG